MVFVSGWQGGRRASGIEDSVRRIAKNTLFARWFRVSGGDLPFHWALDMV